MKEDLPTVILPARDWFDLAFFGDFLHKTTKSKEQLNEKRYRLSEESISPRIVNHWVDLDLLSDERPQGKGWHMLSISEMIWLKIIIKLRKFGMELNKIKKVKEYLEIYSSGDNQSKFPELDFYIIYGLNKNEPVKLIVFDSGKSCLLPQSDIDLFKQYSFIRDDFISIDINMMVSDSFKDKVNSTDYLHYSKSEIEKEVYQSIYVDDVQSISIKVSGGKEYLIKKEKVVESKQEINALLRKTGSHFEETTMHIGNRKVHKITEKKKLKKK